MKLDLPRVRGAHGECGGAGNACTAEDRNKISIKYLEESTSDGRGRLTGEDERAVCKEEKEKRNSQGKDPRTFEESSQGGDFSTLQTNSQAEDPRTFKVPVERWRVQEKQKEDK